MNEGTWMDQKTQEVLSRVEDINDRNWLYDKLYRLMVLESQLKGD